LGAGTPQLTEEPRRGKKRAHRSEPTEQLEAVEGAPVLGDAPGYFGPGGELRFYEHVIPNCQPKRVVVRVLDYSGLFPAITGGCHPARDTTEAILRAGFEIEEIDRFGFSPQRFQPQIPHICDAWLH
jgi:hypothetical protein